MVYYEENSNQLILAVFDGHGAYGHDVASTIRNRFVESFVDLSFLDTEKRLIRSLSSAEEHLLKGTTINAKMSGCTAHIACLVRNNTNNAITLHSVNVGDSEYAISQFYWIMY